MPNSTWGGRASLFHPELNDCKHSKVGSSSKFLCLLSLFCRSVLSNSAIPWTTACQASFSITHSRSLLKLMSIESVMQSCHLILCRPPLLPPSFFPRVRVFSNVSVLCFRWPKYWSFSFSISPYNEYSGLISFRIDRLYLFAVQGTLKSLLQHHSSKQLSNILGKINIMQCDSQINNVSLFNYSKNAQNNSNV